MPLLERTGLNEEHSKRIPISGTFHMLRHFFVTALIQSGVNPKVAQTLAGHHSTSFTLDQYADAVPQLTPAPPAAAVGSSHPLYRRKYSRELDPFFNLARPERLLGR